MRPGFAKVYAEQQRQLLPENASAGNKKGMSVTLAYMLCLHINYVIFMFSYYKMSDLVFPSSVCPSVLTCAE